MKGLVLPILDFASIGASDYPPTGSVMLAQDVDGKIKKMDSSGVITAVEVPAGAWSDVRYTHTQSSANATWTISHSLGKIPSVSCFNNSGEEIFGSVTHPNTNTTVITFGGAIAGKAYLN